MNSYAVQVGRACVLPLWHEETHTGSPREKYFSEILGSHIHVTITGQPNCPNYPNGPLQSLTRVQSGPE